MAGDTWVFAQCAKWLGVCEFFCKVCENSLRVQNDFVRFAKISHSDRNWFTRSTKISLGVRNWFAGCAKIHTPCEMIDEFRMPYEKFAGCANCLVFLYLKIPLQPIIENLS